MNDSTQTLQGSTRLVFDAVTGVTNIVEQMHETIARHPLPWSSQEIAPSRAHGIIAAAVYASIRGINGAVSEVVNHSFEWLPDTPGSSPRSAGEIRTLAALNGVCGDYLEASDNELAIPMELLAHGAALELETDALAAVVPQPSPHLVVLVHGLGLSEQSWNRKEVPSIGSELQAELGYTPLYLRYNSGRHISTNGQELAQLLGQLCEAWPVEVESLSLIGHSMGGLVIHSACFYAELAQRHWLQSLQRVLFLGTPHHGAPLAKAGHALDLAMQQIPYTRPLAIGRRRSAGIKDLRHGNLLDEDWQELSPDQPGTDTRRRVPLLADVDYYFAAASVGQNTDDLLGHLLGDLLVRLGSAFGAHADELRSLRIESDNCRVFQHKNHFDLLDDARVHRQIISWFQPHRESGTIV